MGQSGAGPSAHTGTERPSGSSPPAVPAQPTHCRQMQLHESRARWGRATAGPQNWEERGSSHCALWWFTVRSSSLRGMDTSLLGKSCPSCRALPLPLPPSLPQAGDRHSWLFTPVPPVTRTHTSSQGIRHLPGTQGLSSPDSHFHVLCVTPDRTRGGLPSQNSIALCSQHQR